MKTLLMMTTAMTALVAFDDATAQVRIQTAPGAFAYTLGDPDRAMIGVSTRSSGRRDTLGLLIESVTRGGPAEKAGIEEGDRLVSVNGVNLRLAAADAGEPDMDGVANRRLIRELEKQKAGDEVELRVYRDGNTRTVRVKTVTAEELNTESTMVMSGATRRASDRPVLGISLGGNGSRRDTLGILVVGVSDSGPAARAGIDEGDRVASINGVDLRVAAEDAGDWQAANARIRRLNREMEKVKAGDAVELRVYSGGQTRSVRVEAGRAADVRDDGFFFDGSGFIRRLEQLDLPRAIRVRPRVSAGIEERPAVAVPRADLQRKLRVVEEAMKVPQLKLRQNLESGAEAVRKARVVRRSIVI